MDPSNYPINSPTLSEMNAQSYGVFAPAFAAILVIAFRLIYGRWPHPLLAIGAPVWIMLGGIAWMFISMNPSGDSTTGEAICFVGGAIRGVWFYILPVGGFAVIEAAALAFARWWRGDVLGNRRTRRKKLTRRGAL
jgi:hypothetical protein